MTSDNVAAFRRPLMRWYRLHGRHELPWRNTRDPYAVLVSEVMLQQTQVGRVRPYYERWLRRWPDAPALAAEPMADVIRAWSGLGYNRRATYLHRMAGAAVERFGGRVPATPELLRQLPGVGEYTANAVACFAAGAAVPVVETNIARVLARAFLGKEAAREAKPSAIREAARVLLPARGAREHNLALMDLGALVCLPRGPSCAACPVGPRCRWLSAGRPAGTRPVSLAPRFEATARYARGRIIAALRSADSLSARELAAMLPGPHSEQVARYIEGLAQHGLIEPCGNSWRLAGSQGSTSMASPKL